MASKAPALFVYVGTGVTASAPSMRPYAITPVKDAIMKYPVTIHEVVHEIVPLEALVSLGIGTVHPSQDRRHI
jgi:hypothetical protein